MLNLLCYRLRRIVAEPIVVASVAHESSELRISAERVLPLGLYGVAQLRAACFEIGTGVLRAESDSAGAGDRRGN